MIFVFATIIQGQFSKTDLYGEVYEEGPIDENLLEDDAKECFDLFSLNSISSFDMISGILNSANFHYSFAIKSTDKPLLLKPPRHLFS